jgi:hypothetical protein
VADFSVDVVVGPLDAEFLPSLAATFAVEKEEGNTEECCKAPS